MPSLRKVIEDLEYNTLPSNTRADFATAATNKVAFPLIKANGVTKEKQVVPAERLAFEDPAELSNVESGKGSGQSKNTKPHVNDIIEILSDDDEEISLHNLAKLKENESVAKTTDSKTVEKSIVSSVKNDTVQVRATFNHSVSSSKETSVSAVHHVTEKAERSQSAATRSTTVAGKAGVNSGGINRPHANNPSTAKSLVVRAPPTNQNPLPTRASTADLSSDVPQTLRPYSSNPIVQKNATVVLQNVRNKLDISLPTQKIGLQTSLLGPTATMPDVERWSEFRIDAAATTEDLEAIRRRLLTLTDRVELRLKERRFVEAIGMMENDEGFGKGDSIEEIIRSWADHVERNPSGNLKCIKDSSVTEDDLKRKLSRSDTGCLEENATAADPRKRQRSSCCPFCLSTNLFPEDNAYSTCSVCDENSNICIHCRTYCNHCHRLACEDCLMVCDTCFSRECCSDCMAKTGRCPTCSKLKFKTDGKSTSARVNGKLQPLCMNGYETKTPLPILQAVAPDYSLHRFVIFEKRSLGLTITDNRSLGTATIVHVQNNSLAESIGLRHSDQICFPFTNGAQPSNSYDLFIKAAKLRPLILEVKRKPVNPQIGRSLHRFHITDEGHLGMSVKAMDSQGGNYTLIMSIKPGSLGDLYGICKGDIICKPYTNGSAYINVYSWFMEVAKQRPVTFEVWRDRSSRPTTNWQTHHLLTKSVNPFVWDVGGTTISTVNDDTHSGLIASGTK